MKTLFCIFLIMVVFVLPGCKSAPTSVPAGPSYCQGGINLLLKADANLNLYQGKPHTLLLCAYELKEPNAFNQLVNETGGVAKLMECSSFGESVTFVKRIVLQPGERKGEVLDRAEGSRYLALIAGYYVTQKGPSYLLMDIPSKSCRKNILDLNLLLGAQSMKAGEK